MHKFINRFRSDDGAAGSVELIIIIALTVFAILAVFKFILQPVRDGAEQVGSTTGKFLDRLTKPENVGKDVDSILEGR